MVDDADPGQTVADHVVAGAAIPARNPKAKLAPTTPPDVCANCGAKLQGPTCHQCGQTVDTYHRPLLALLREMLDGLFSLDGRAAQTLPDLMVRPGRVTRRYLQGARARFVQPFKLYILASLLFFLTAPVLTGGINVNAPGEAIETNAASSRELSELRADIDALAQERPELAPLLTQMSQDLAAHEAAAEAEEALTGEASSPEAAQ